jgi:hypothetical protein
MPATANTPCSPPLADPASILDHFAELPDPRRQQGQVHLLQEILFMAVCAVICSADSWEQIAEYSRSKIDWLQTFLTLPGGIPSHDTFRRVFCLLDPVAFPKCFSSWMTALMARRGLTPFPTDPAPLKPIAIDGKTQRVPRRATTYLAAPDSGLASCDGQVACSWHP